MHSFFDALPGYAHVHHLALNSPLEYRNARNAAVRYQQAVHVFEGDICWAREGNGLLFYFFHPRIGFDFPDAACARRKREKGDIMLLEDVAEPEQNTYFVFELKLGDAAPREAIPALAAILNERFQGRFWIDSFSRVLLHAVRQADPAIPTSLHTEFAGPGRLAATAPYKPILGFPSIASLDEADAVAIRCHFGQGITARGARGVHDAGKHLILSRLFNPNDLAFAQAQGAVAGYLHAPPERFF